MVCKFDDAKDSDPVWRTTSCVETKTFLAYDNSI